MSEILNILRQFMVEEKIDYLLVNSTNQFLVEYNTLAENSRYHLTGFTGSTGDALVSMTDVFLFVDGRYHIQADQEVDKNIITVVKLQTGQNFFDEMFNKTPKEKFIEIIQNGNLGALEKVFEEFFADHIAMVELLEKQGLTEMDVKNFILENGDFIEERQNDIYIELGAKILGHEG